MLECAGIPGVLVWGSLPSAENISGSCLGNISGSCLGLLPSWVCWGARVVVPDSDSLLFLAPLANPDLQIAPVPPRPPQV